MRHIGDDKPAGAANFAGVGDGLAEEEFEQAALAAAVAPFERDAFAARYIQRDGRADGAPVVAGRDGEKLRQPRAGMDERGELERTFQLFVLQKRLLFLERALAARVERLCGFHHFCGFCADVALIGFHAGVALAVFRLFHAVAPAGGAARSLLHVGDFALKLFVLRFFKSLPPLEALPPGGVAAARDFDRRAVDGQDMVDARVEHLPVVRDEDEAALAAQIRRDGLARGGVEMVRRLVDKQEPAFVQEQRSQQRFRLFAAGERIERGAQARRDRRPAAKARAPAASPPPRGRWRAARPPSGGTARRRGRGSNRTAPRR